jgi:hypothetical protein
MWMNITGGATTLSQDAKRQGKKTFLADKFSVLLCGWRDAFYVGGNLLTRKSHCNLFGITKLRILCLLLPALLLEIKGLVSFIAFSTFFYEKQPI